MFPTFKLTMLSLAAVLGLGAAVARSHPASGIVADRDGRIYFSDLETVWRLDARGSLAPFRPGARGRHVHELILDAEGNLYGADIAYEPSTQKWVTGVWRMTPSGALTYLVAPTTNPPRALTIFRDAEGNTYAVEQNDHSKVETLIFKRTPAGEVSVLAGGAYGHADGKNTAASFGSIVSLAIGPDRTLYLTDCSAVRRIWPDGTVRTVGHGQDVPDDDDATSVHEHAPTLYGLAVDATGRVYTADFGRRRVIRLDPDGSSTPVLRSELPWSPTGVALTADGRLLALEVTSGGARTRVRELSPAGGVRVLATVGAKGVRSTAPTQGEATLPRAAPAPAEAAEHAHVARRLNSSLALYFGFGALAIASLAGFNLYRRKGV